MWPSQAHHYPLRMAAIVQLIVGVLILCYLTSWRSTAAEYHRPYAAAVNLMFMAAGAYLLCAGAAWTAAHVCLHGGGKAGERRAAGDALQWAYSACTLLALVLVALYGVFLLAALCGRSAEVERFVEAVEARVMGDRHVGHTAVFVAAFAAVLLCAAVALAYCCHRSLGEIYARYEREAEERRNGGETAVGDAPRRVAAAPGRGRHQLHIAATYTSGNNAAAPVGQQQRQQDTLRQLSRIIDSAFGNGKTTDGDGDTQMLV